jgi:hypothetical protein
MITSLENSETIKIWIILNNWKLETIIK